MFMCERGVPGGPIVHDDKLHPKKSAWVFVFHFCHISVAPRMMTLT